ncbi:MAG: IgGFc-binding protein [Deltaproteobacteria bacterium]|nr:IgGFc-binding protein [Deltaproteobacteria bacterium]
MMRTRFPLVAAVVALSLLQCGPTRASGDASADTRTATEAGPQRAWTGCPPGQQRCFQNEIAQNCVAQGEFSTYTEDDCTARGLRCFEETTDGVVAARCLACRPGARRCSDDTTAVEECAPNGSGFVTAQECNLEASEACRNAQCLNLCRDNSIANTNIGCEYFSVDLDNAVTGEGRSAASQQYAVVVSNPDPALTARVVIEMNTAPPGATPRPQRVESGVIAPGDLETFRLPAREVDCSPPGTFNRGTHTCLSSNAYRVVSTIPVIAYQFNPLENSGVFSNDASLLIPTNSLSGEYMVTSWPQTIAASENASTNFGEHLRAFLTIVGTETNTRVRITSTARVVPTGPMGPLPMGLEPNTPFEVTLGAFDVLNLETGAFGADFTGSRIEPMGGAVAVFTGSEASDSPVWTSISERACCADHLEEQLLPRRTAGQDFVLVKTASRSAAVSAAGGNVAVVNEPQWFRMLNASNDVAMVTTTLPVDVTDPERGNFEFMLRPGEHRTLRALSDFEAHSNRSLIMSTVTGSQQTTGIPFDQPGGDPSFILIPPVEQWRSRYVFLTPDKYAFDFVTIVARRDTQVRLDNTPLPFADCPMTRADSCVDRTMVPCPPPTYVVYRCQLSFPRVIPTLRAPNNVVPQRQGDGVHVIESNDTDQGVMVLVNGFDSFVGYGYAGGTRTQTIN